MIKSIIKKSMSSISAAVTVPGTKDYSGSWYLNTATSIANSTSVPAASAATQWSIIPALNNVNATALLNSSGSITVPEKGKWAFQFATLMNGSATLTEFQVWFIVKSASGQYSPRYGLNRQTSSSYNIGQASTSWIFNLYAGDTVIPMIFQISGATQTLSVNNNGQNGTSAGDSTVGTVLSVNLLNRS